MAAAATSDPLLALRGVVKSWPKRPAPVLDGVELSVGAGEMALVNGANGAGKTTILRIVTGMIEPERGTVRVAGLNPARDGQACRRELAYLSAATGALYARLTAADHLRMWARLTCVPAAERPARVSDAIAAFALEELADRRVDRMSAGQRQRVRLAMTFLPPARVVLLDEPGNSLDEDGWERLRAAVARSRAAGACVVWCSPAPEAVGAADARRLRLRAGRLEAEPGVVA